MQPQVAWSPATRGSRLRVSVTQVLEDPHAALCNVLDATPGWQGGASAQASVAQVSGAMTNLVYVCRSPAATANSAVIVRVFGQGGALFSQRDERNIFLLASNLGLGPKCLVEFENGRVEEFLPGDNLTCDSLRAPGVSAAIARAMAQFHVCMLTALLAASGDGTAGAAAAEAAAAAADGAAAGGSSGGQAAGGKGQGAGAAREVGLLQPAIYERIRKWHAAAVDCGIDLEQAGLGGLLDELDQLRARLAEAFPAWVAFCHNDLQYGNMLLFGGGASSAPSSPRGASLPGGASPPGGRHAPAAVRATGAVLAAAAEALADGSTGGGSGVSVKLIDYEYSTLNDVAFDVANHFCEWAYNYHSDQAHVFQEQRLPSEEQQLHFCRGYVGAMQQFLKQQAAGAAADGAATGGGQAASSSLPSVILAAGAAAAQRSVDSNSAGGSAEEHAARLLLRKAQAHMPLVHIAWGLWGLIQDKLSDVDFDYVAYGLQRVQRWHSTKLPLLRGVSS